MIAALRLVPMSAGIPKNDRERWARWWVWTWTQIARIRKREDAAYERGWTVGRHNVEYVHGFREGNRIGRIQGANRIGRGVVEKPCAICGDPFDVEKYWIDRCLMLGRDRAERLEMWRAYCAERHGHPCPQETE